MVAHPVSARRISTIEKDLQLLLTLYIHFLSEYCEKVLNFRIRVHYIELRSCELDKQQCDLEPKDN